MPLKIVLTLASICAAICVGCLSHANSHGVKVPGDDVILRLFRIHHGELQSLCKMVIEDKATYRMSVFNESTIAKLTSETRRNAYRNLLQLSPGITVGVNYDDSVRFIFASSGQAIGPGWAKGLQFIPAGARPIGTKLENLDGLIKSPAGVYLREIEPQWFVFFQQDD